MRIDHHRKSTRNIDFPDKKDVRGVKPSMRGDFSRDLAEKEDQYYRSRMQEILKRIDTISDRLARNLSLEDLISYKKLVQSFLKEATARAYLVNQERSFTRRGARSILVTVEKINHEVEELVNGFTTRRNDPMEILAALDKIRGLLVDLLA
ncbi:MAG: YaaR family protein [Syntrophomonadaceae bacterium]|nr:YaaR family protein [Syntrophomonadaceae bacterium]